MKKRLLLIIIPVLVVVLVLHGLKSKPEGEEDLQTTVARLGNLEERSDGSGTLEGITKIDVSAETSGLVESIPIEVGDTVEVDQLLLSLETTQARANLNSAASIIQSSVISLEQAERELERTETLFNENLSSSEEYLLSQENVDLRNQELNRAYSSYAVAENNLGKTSYYSPIRGIITSLNIEEGETALQGTMNNEGTILMTVEDMSTFRIRVTMVESEIVAVRSGMPAEVTLDALPDSVFTGIVEQVGLSATNSGGGETAAEFEVLLRLDSVDESMRSGMSASVEIVTAAANHCVIVPVQSIVQRTNPENPSEQISCVLVIKDGIIETIPVETGVSSIMEVQVEGISAGEQVISGPVLALRTLNSGDTADLSSGSQEDEDDSDFQFQMQGMPGNDQRPSGPPPGGGGGRNGS